MKFFLLFLATQSICFFATAQKPAKKDFGFVAGIDMAYATGNFHFAHKLGYGLSIQYEYAFADNSSATLNTGYTYFAAQKNFKDSVPSSILTEQLQDFSMVPFLMGVKIDNEGKFYIHPQVGVAFRNKPFVSACYAFAVGMVTSRHADFSLRYQAIQKKGVVASFFALRASYIF